MKLLPDRRIFLTLALPPAAGLIHAGKVAGAADRPVFGAVHCEGSYHRHLQGVCTNRRDAIYWSFTDVLVRTDPRGKIMKEVSVPSHHGDLCYDGGALYVAVNLGLFNDPSKRADSWVYVYDGRDLALIAKHPVPQLVYGAGAIARREARFMVAGGLPEGFEENYVYEYDREFRFIRRHVLKSGYTYLGIQTAEYTDDGWWFGCYGKPEILLRADKNMRSVRRFRFDCSCGIVSVGRNAFLVAGAGNCSRQGGCQGDLVMAFANKEKGLVSHPPSDS